MNTQEITAQSVGDDQCVKIGIVDLDGILRGKYISGKKFKSALGSHAGFCDVVLGWDREDVIIDGLDLTGWHTGFPDAPITLAAETFRLLPLENNTPFCLGQFTDKYQSFCPRSILKSLCDKAAESGLEVIAGMEYEFTIFRETPESLREKNYHNLTPISPASNSYSVLNTAIESDFYTQIFSACRDMDIPLEALHEETGAGFMEAAITVSNALETADRAILFKNLLKTIASRNGLLASFMAKWTTKEQGQSGHIHISLKDKNGHNIFYDSDNEHGMSKQMRHFLGGQQKLLPEFLALMTPTVNSFKRLCPGFWAPTWGSWGIDNRTVALRVIPGSEKSQRIEYRIPGADSNPYLALAAALASGLWGMENEIEPSPISTANAYTQKAPEGLALPTSLSSAATRFAGSQVARHFFGAEFITHYARTREAEEERFQQNVTDWELARYIETS